MINDTELLRRYTDNHSEEAFTTLVRRHLDLAYFAALRRTNGDAQLAEEVTQQVFVSLAHNASTLQRHAVLTGWLYVATRHAASNAMRAETRRLTREKEAHAMQETTTAPNPESDWNLLRPQLDHALDALNDPDRTAVLLRFFENRPFAEIGTMLRVSEDAARIRTDRALDKLRNALVRRGITSTSAALALALTSQSALAAPPSLSASVTGFVFTHTTAAAAAGTATTLNLWNIMSTTKTLLGVATATAALAISTVIYEGVEIQKARAGLAAATQENAALRTRLQQQEKRTGEIETRLSATETLNTSLQKNIAEAARKPGAQAKPATATRNNSSGRNAQYEILAASPEFQELELKQFRNSLLFKYGPLYLKLGLNPQQISDFEAAMTEQHQASLDTMVAARAQGLSTSDPRLSSLNNSVNKTAEDKLRATLGESGYEQYQAYSKTSYARSAVEAIASAFYSTNEPLSAKQADQLAQLVIANTQQPSVDATGMAPRGSGALDWDNVATQAQNVLSPAQIDSLHAMAEKNRVQRQLADLVNKLINGPGTTSSETGSSPSR